jgi:hypothetical protein
MKLTMKRGLLSIILAVATTLTVAMPSSRAQAPSAYGLHELPAGGQVRFLLDNLTGDALALGRATGRTRSV